MSITDEPVANFGAEDDRLQPVDEADGVIRTSANVKTAVVVVHGMGSQKPRETVNGFVRTALENFDGGRIYYSRPDKITGSYEARRLLASALVDMAETHWERGEPLPTPNPMATNAEADLEEPMHLRK